MKTINQVFQLMINFLIFNLFKLIYVVGIAFYYPKKFKEKR